MDFHSVMETFAEAWVAANTHTPLTEAAEQGLINSSTNQTNSSQVISSNSSSNSQSSTILNPSVSSHSSSQPVLTVLQETSKSRTENFSLGDISKCNSSQSPADSINETLKSYKVQEVHGKCLPVHCIIEQNPGPQACGQYVELDSYAIVPNETLFSDLVRTALGKLGYSVSQMLGAKGSIQVKKWKPLAFDQITESPEATVGDILGELTTVASLHVRLYSVPDNPHEWKDITVRNAVLELLREMSQSKLAKICPLSQPMLSNIINNRYMGKIGKEKCQEFGQWYLTYRKQNPEKSTPDIIPSDKPVDGRLTFHPTKELPIMRDWFHSCRNPSKRTLQMYVDILNQGPVRQQERPKIAFSTLKNWWKNEKQRERKNQRSEEDIQSPDSGSKLKKRKKSSNSTSVDPNDGSTENSFSPLNSRDSPPPKTNNFTLINHSENESDEESLCPKDHGSNIVTSSNRPISSQEGTKINCKFSPLLTQESALDRHCRELSENGSSSLMNGHIIQPLKDSVGVESHYFQKIHSLGLDHPHSLFTFPETHHKIFCERTSLVENHSSHLSSEEDVDVGI